MRWSENITDLKNTYNEKQRKYNKLLNASTGASSVGVFSGISTIGKTFTVVGLPISASLGVISTVSTCAGGILLLISKKYKKKLLKCYELIDKKPTIKITAKPTIKPAIKITTKPKIEITTNSFVKSIAEYVPKITKLDQALKGHTASYTIEIQDNLDPLNHFKKTKEVVESHRKDLLKTMKGFKIHYDTGGNFRKEYLRFKDWKT